MFGLGDWPEETMSVKLFPTENTDWRKGEATRCGLERGSFTALRRRSVVFDIIILYDILHYTVESSRATFQRIDGQETKRAGG
jgi:hypothetical protein